nr:hypothetical protein [uncultured Desulfobulbus sp.]
MVFSRFQLKSRTARVERHWALVEMMRSIFSASDQCPLQRLGGGRESACKEH